MYYESVGNYGSEEVAETSSELLGQVSNLKSEMNIDVQIANFVALKLAKKVRPEIKVSLWDTVLDVHILVRRFPKDWNMDNETGKYSYYIQQ